jgi:hypothetical protein
MQSKINIDHWNDSGVRGEVYVQFSGVLAQN